MNEKPIEFTISSQILGLEVGKKYAVLRFEQPCIVPSQNFTDSMNWTKSWQFVPNDTTHNMENFDTFGSDKSIFYRVVAYEGVLDQTNVPEAACSSKMLYASLFVFIILVFNFV